MANQDYLPKQDGKLVVWLNQFKTELATAATDLGLVAGDVTAITGDASSLLTALQNQSAEAATRKSVTAAKEATMKSIVPKLRAFARRVKVMPGYTDAIGQRLGIIRPDASGDMSVMATIGERPTLTIGPVRNGNVAIRFRKNGFTGVQIAGRRGSETEFVMLKTQLRSPFVDERMNLGKGPETRYYQARYLDGDDLVGEASDILVVTVPE